MRDPSTWKLSHCFPNMARNAARRALARELNRMDWTWTVEVLGLDGAGTSSWFGIPEVVLSIRRMLSDFYAIPGYPVCPCTSMKKAGNSMDFHEKSWEFHALPSSQ